MRVYVLAAITTPALRGRLFVAREQSWFLWRDSYRTKIKTPHARTVGWGLNFYAVYQKVKVRGNLLGEKQPWGREVGSPYAYCPSLSSCPTAFAGGASGSRKPVRRFASSKMIVKRSKMPARPKILGAASSSKKMRGIVRTSSFNRMSTVCCHPRVSPVMLATRVGPPFSTVMPNVGASLLGSAEI